MVTEHASDADCWCQPTTVVIPGRTSVVRVHHDTLTGPEEQAERATRVFEAIADVRADPDD